MWGSFRNERWSGHMNLRVHRKNDKHHWSLMTSTLGRDESSGQPSDSVQSVRVRILVRVVSLPALYHRLNFVFCSVLWSLFVCHCFLLLFVSVLWHLFILYLSIYLVRGGACRGQQHINTNIHGITCRDRVVFRRERYRASGGERTTTVDSKTCFDVSTRWNFSTSSSVVTRK